MKKLALVLFAAAVLILGPHAPAWALHPLFTEEAETMAPAAYDLELTGEYGSYAEGSATEFSLSASGGIIKGLDLNIYLPFLMVDPDEGSSENGIGDIEVGLKYNFLEMAEGTPGLSVKGLVKLPTADEDKGLGSGQWDFGIMLLADYEVAPVTFYANLAYTIVGEPEGVDLDNIFSYSFAVEYALNQEWSVVGEIAGETRAAKGEDGPVLLSLGGVWNINEMYRMDGGVRIGVTDSAPDWSLALGFGVSF